jgi:hypothetical protein
MDGGRWRRAREYGGPALKAAGSILLFPSLFAVPLARERLFDAALFSGLEVVGVTLDFLDDVLLLYLALEAAERIFQRLAFLDANFCQKGYTSQPAEWLSPEYVMSQFSSIYGKEQPRNFPKYREPPSGGP